MPDGLRLQTVLLQLQIEHRQLADSAGISKCNMSRFLSGQRVPSTETRRKLAAGLRELIDEENII